MTPATPEQLKSLTCIVYGILNRRNGRWYIGQTLRSFHRRYTNGKWWEKTTNDPLRNAYRRYGPDAFEVYIFESSVGCEQRLDELERQYVIRYDCLFPKGYNFESGGQQYQKRVSAATKAKMSRVQMQRAARNHLLLDENENECRFSNLATFATERGLNKKMLSNLLRGTVYRYRGYHLPTTCLAKVRQDSVLQRVRGPDGRVYEFYNAAAFAREHGLIQTCLVKVLNGQQLHHKGFYLASSPERPIGYRWGNESNRNKRYERIVLERDGQQFEITNDVGEFCSQHGVSKRDVYMLTKGDQKTAHGFRLVRVEYTESYLAKHPELRS